jgi:hypothetical protein
MKQGKKSVDFDDPVRKTGDDATAMFDDSSSNPTERASSEALVPDVGVDELDNVDEGPMDAAAPISGADDADLSAEDDDDDDDDVDEYDEEDDADEVGETIIRMELRGLGLA